MKTSIAFTFAVVAAALLASAAPAQGLSIEPVPMCRDTELASWPTPMRGLAAFVGADMHAGGAAGCKEVKQLLHVTFEGGIGCNSNLGNRAVRALLSPRLAANKRRRMFAFWEKKTWEDAGKVISDVYEKSPKENLDNLGKGIGAVAEEVGKGFEDAGKAIKDTFVGIGKDLTDAVVGAGNGISADAQAAARQLDSFFRQAGQDFENAIAQIALQHTLTARDFEREFAKIGQDFERFFKGVGLDFEKAGKDFVKQMEHFGAIFEKAIADILNGAGDVNSDAMLSLLGSLTGTLGDVCPGTCAAPGSFCAPQVAPVLPSPDFCRLNPFSKECYKPGPAPVLPSPVTPVTPSRPTICCRSHTKECKACEAGLTVAEFCNRNPFFEGCRKPLPTPVLPSPTKPTCKNDFHCPAHSSRKPHRKCYDTIDDCACKHGYEMVLGRGAAQGKGTCVKTKPKCKNDFHCPANSSRKPHRKCYDTIDDCQCAHGFTMNKWAERCEPVHKPVHKPTKPTTPVTEPSTRPDEPTKPTTTPVTKPVEPTPEDRPVKPDPTDSDEDDKTDSVAPKGTSSTTKPPAPEKSILPLAIGIGAGVLVLVVGVIVWRKRSRKEAALAAQDAGKVDDEKPEDPICCQV